MQLIFIYAILIVCHGLLPRSIPNATGILITADGGGSNGVKIHIPITLCHFPRAMSKWNVIEHQLFSFISINWRAKPLTSLAVILELISHTTTNIKQGLKLLTKSLKV